MNHSPARQADVTPDAAMRALIEHIVRKHREAAQDHERAGRSLQAEREYDRVRRIENYLARHPGAQQPAP